MLDVMSKERGWSHDEMMRMSRRVFLRYYGYWYAERFNEAIQQEWEEAKGKANRELNERR
jgi:hypothetical protein